MLTRLKELNPDSMLDIGCGAGTYADLFAREFPNAYRIGVEVWEPYVEQFDLGSKYDHLIIEDVRDMEPWPHADVVVLGDVLEHMPESDALDVWDEARRVAYRAVYLSIPIVRYPQGALEGNPHEIHVKEDWTHEEVLSTFPGINDSWTGSIIGVYEALV